MNTLRCHSTYPGARKYSPFSNAPSDGIYWVVDVIPQKLFGLAQFLSDSLEGNLAHASSSLKVTCYGKETQADVERRLKPGKNTENIIKCYGLESKQAVIEDWHFGRLEIGDKPEDYFNRNAEKMRKEGVVKVCIRYAGWRNESKVYDLTV